MALHWPELTGIQELGKGSGSIGGAAGNSGLDSMGACILLLSSVLPTAALAQEEMEQMDTRSFIERLACHHAARATSRDSRLEGPVTVIQSFGQDFVQESGCISLHLFTFSPFRACANRNPPVPPPDDDKAPDIAPEERQRRRTTPSKQIDNEEWYQYGKEVFVAKCAGCHPGGMNQVRISKGLNLEDLERWGFIKEPAKITEIIRYGKGSMPGYAKDCPEKSGYEQCGVVVPLDEATLIDVEDFMMNRANSGWRGRG
ncbi:unnamed protein product [Effrenium voratum]|nr:unnamed protein product [Effrenium voratum]